MFGMNSTEPIFPEKDAAAIISSPEIRLTAENLSHLFTDSLGPALGFEFEDVSFSQLHREVATTVTTAMTAVLLPMHAGHKNGKSMGGNVIQSPPGPRSIASRRTAI